MLSIAVCDDMILECVELAKGVKRILEQKGIEYILREFTNGKELLEAEEAFDIIFLDIKMPDLNGMELAKILRNKETESLLVFVTSTKEYVFEAYDVEAFHYLMKPIGQKKLVYILNKAINKVNYKKNQDFLVVSAQKQKQKILLKDIYYIESIKRIIKIHCKESIVVTYEQIGNLEKKLMEKGFFRCHKSYLVNLIYVDTFNKTEIILENNDKILISRRRYEGFSKAVLLSMKKEGGIV